jgi:hypothetical protein
MHHKTPSGWKTIDRTFASSPPPTILPTSKLFEYTETLDFLSSPRIHSFFSLFPLPGRFTLSEDLSFPGQAVYLPQRDRRSTIRRIDALTLHMLTALRQKEFRTAIWLAEDILRHFPDHDTAQYAAETARRALSIERAPKTGVLSSQDPEKRIERTLPLNLKGLLLETAFRSLEYATRIEIQLDPFLRQQSDWSTTRVDFETRGASARHVLDRLATRNHLAYRFHRDSLIVSTPNRISTPALQKLLLSDSLPSATPPGLLNRLQVTLADGSILPFSPVQPPLTSPPGVRHVRSGIHKIRSTFYSDANNKLIETREVLPPPGNLSWNARIPRTLRIGDRPLCPIEIRSRSSFRGRLRSSTGSSPEIHFEPDSPTTLWTPLNGPGPQHFQLGPKSWTFNIGTVSPNTRRSELVSGTLSPHTPSKSWTSEWLPQTITHLHLYPSPAAFLPELLKSLTHPASRDAESKIIRRLAPFLALEWSRRWPGGAPPWLLSAIQDALHAELPDWPEPDPDTSLFNSPLQKTAWIFEQILRARNLGLAIPENMIAGYLETVRNRQDSQDPISQWSLLLCESLINPSESVDRCIQLLSSTPLETIDSRGLSIALECCLILKLEEESTALRNRILDRKNTREPYSFWGREGHPEWSQDSFSITNRVLRGLSSSPGAHPEEILRGFGYLLARRTRGPGWGTDRNSFEILLTILSLPYPASLSPETSWEIQIGSDRWKIKAQSGGPQIHPYQGSSPDSRLFSPTLSNGTSPIFLSIAYQPLLRQPNVPSRIERRFTPVPSLGPTTYLVQLVSDPPLASGAYRLEEPLPPASRLIATTPMSREDEESLRIEPSLTLDLHQTISKSKTIFFSYLIECSIPGTYQLPPTRMSPIDRPEASAWGFPSTIRIPAPTQPR